MKQDVITMTRKQLNRLDIISKANADFLTVSEAASLSLFRKLVLISKSCAANLL